MESGYVHGYSAREQRRLQEQASTLTELLHADSRFPEGSLVLEAGCGVGSQTVTLAARNPTCRLVSVDISAASLREADRRLRAAGCGNVRLQQADIFRLPFAPATFDQLFVCFVLEHLPDPVAALAGLGRLLKPGGGISAIEGDHGSAYFHPESADARRAIQCQVALQARAGGNALIGRELYPLLTRAGFTGIRVSPRLVYVDGSRPGLAEGFTRRTFTAMIEGVRGAALTAGLIEPAAFDRGIRDLARTAEADGVFCYTFFKAVATWGGGILA